MPNGFIKVSNPLIDSLFPIFSVKQEPNNIILSLCEMLFLCLEIGICVVKFITKIKKLNFLIHKITHKNMKFKIK